MLARALSLSLSAAVLSCVPFLAAQVHGVPASVSSFGFGGNFSSAPGVPASVTSLGPNGFNRGPVFFSNCCFNGLHSSAQAPIFVGRHHGDRRAFFPVAVPVYSLPYTPVYLVQPEAAAYAEDEDDQGGPTIFDRRGSGRRVRERIVEEEPAPAAPAVIAPAPESVTPQPSTLLVYKDGHKSEVENYAIIGDTLFNLSEGRSYKILLADLDLTATRRANTERGVDFQLPPGSAH